MDARRSMPPVLRSSNAWRSSSSTTAPAPERNGNRAPPESSTDFTDYTDSNAAVVDARLRRAPHDYKGRENESLVCCGLIFAALVSHAGGRRPPTTAAPIREIRVIRGELNDVDFAADGAACESIERERRHVEFRIFPGN